MECGCLSSILYVNIFLRFYIRIKFWNKSTLAHLFILKFLVIKLLSEITDKFENFAMPFLKYFSAVFLVKLSLIC